jgi:hypothetical protein
MKISITQMTDDCKALGAYLQGSIYQGVGEIMIDIQGIEYQPDLSDSDKKEIIANVIKHEIHHALSDFFNIELTNPDGTCGGEANQEMVVVPLDEHDKLVQAKNNEIDRLKDGIESAIDETYDDGVRDLLGDILHNGEDCSDRTQYGKEAYEGIVSVLKSKEAEIDRLKIFAVSVEKAKDKGIERLKKRNAQLLGLLYKITQRYVFDMLKSDGDELVPLIKQALKGSE